MTSFSDFGLAAPILQALVAEGYETPTPIQAQAIPSAMQGRDILGIAQTGTGKTAAFALPILHRLTQGERHNHLKGCRVLVLAPTRELAGQIADSFRAYGKNLKLRTEVIFGGVSLGRQEAALARGVDVLVATPGRLLDLIDRGSLTLKHLEILVLDEADQMLDLGFIHALKRIVRLLPRQRQSLFFSATMPKMISGLADEYLTDPVKVAVAPVATTAERIDQRVMFVPQAQKVAVLRAVLADPAIDRTLVFTRTKHGADKVVRQLTAAGIESAAIHGNKSQNHRERVLGAFRNGKCRVLIATDIAARGIDVEGVSHVINFDLPNVPESYVHRIGRTARAGAEGIAVSFCADDERPYLRDIEKLTRLKVPVVAIPEGIDLTVVEVPRPAQPQGRQPDQRSGQRQGQRSGQPGGRRDGDRDRRGGPGRGEGRGEGRSERPAERSSERSSERSGDRSARPQGQQAPRDHVRGGGRFGELVARIGERAGSNDRGGNGRDGEARAASAGPSRQGGGRADGGQGQRSRHRRRPNREGGDSRAE